MRLIDKKAVLEAVTFLPAELDAETVQRCIEVLSNQPTVDAVPIEWIENYLRNYRYMAPIEKSFVREMIKAWEEKKEE